MFHRPPSFHLPSTHDGLKKRSSILYRQRLCKMPRGSRNDVTPPDSQSDCQFGIRLGTVSKLVGKADSKGTRGYIKSLIRAMALWLWKMPISTGSLEFARLGRPLHQSSPPRLVDQPDPPSLLVSAHAFVATYKTVALHWEAWCGAISNPSKCGRLASCGAAV